MNYVYTVLGTTGAIILAEIVGNYGLGDLVKDFFVRVFGSAKSFAEAKLNRLTQSAAKIRAKL